MRLISWRCVMLSSSFTTWEFVVCNEALGQVFELRDESSRKIAPGGQDWNLRPHHPPRKSSVIQIGSCARGVPSG